MMMTVLFSLTVRANDTSRSMKPAFCGRGGEGRGGEGRGGEGRGGEGRGGEGRGGEGRERQGTTIAAPATVKLLPSWLTMKKTMMEAISTQAALASL